MSLPRIFRPPKRDPDEKGAPLQRTEGEVLLTSRAVRLLDRLQLRASRHLPGQAIGQRSSYRRKPATEFREHRAYVPGDDVRFVDWRASARHEHIFVRQGEQPKEATVYLLLDCSGSMAWGQPPKQTTQLSMAAGLGYLTLARGDRLMVVPFGSRPVQPFGPITGKGQMPSFLKYLRSLPYGGEADLFSAVRRFSRGVSYGGLVFLLSDLIGVQDLTPVLRLLPAPNWETIVLHLLHPAELNPLLNGDLMLVDQENSKSANYDITLEALQNYKARIEEWRTALALACVQKKALYSQIPTDWSFEHQILAHLRSSRVVIPL